MALFDGTFAEKAADLVGTNPFHPDWMRKQRDLLGAHAADPGEVYAWRPDWGLWGPRTVFPDVVRLGERIVDLVEQGGGRLREGAHAGPQELRLYHTLAVFRLYRAHGEAFDDYIDACLASQGTAGPDLKPMWDTFRRDFRRLLEIPGRRWPLVLSAEHLFACFFVLRRAFHYIFFNIIGNSAAVARLRSAVWQSIVTHELRAWSQGLYARMKDTPTLITGPSGTGKELVAQAIGRSLYIPFDPRRRRFAADFTTLFHPVNLSALSPTLIESELFGHVKGAFTGAVEDRKGRLEECTAMGAVFLDEIGELDRPLQVKLLRVLQERRFQPVGTSRTLPFEGKVLAATNRDLDREIEAGRFREDLYYRLCADRVQTPSLQDQLADRPDDLHLLANFICRRVAGEEHADRLGREVVAWVEKNLGKGYAWPGNFRELEQCVRSYAIRREYQPLRREQSPRENGLDQACGRLAEEVLAGRCDLDAIERRLFALVRAKSGNWREAGRLLGRDWRTVKAGSSGEGRVRRSGE